MDKVVALPVLEYDGEPTHITVNGHEVLVEEYKKDPNHYNNLPINKEYLLTISKGLVLLND